MQTRCFFNADENSPSLVELYLDVDVTSFTEENKVYLSISQQKKLNLQINSIEQRFVLPTLFHLTNFAYSIVRHYYFLLIKHKTYSEQ